VVKEKCLQSIRDKEAVLSIKNRIRKDEPDESLDLGLGRRIVATLAALQQNMEVQPHRKDGWCEVRLLISDTAR